MSSKYRSSVSTRLQPDTDDLQKWISFQHVVKVQVFCVNQAASGYRWPASKNGLVSSRYRSSVSTRLHPDTDESTTCKKRISFQHIIKVQVLCVNQAASGYRRSVKKDQLLACWDSSSSKYRSSVSTRLHPDTDDLQKWTSFQHVVKVQVFYVNQAASGYRWSAKMD